MWRNILSSQRYAAIAYGASSAFLARGLALALSLASVSLALPYLGAERFGSWATITTLQLWLQLTDFGLPAAITTPLSTALANNDQGQARRIVATGMITISLASIALFVTLSALIQYLDLTSLLHYENPAHAEELRLAVFVGIGLTALGAPSALVIRAASIQRRGHIANIWLSGGYLAGLAGIYIATRAHADVVTLTTITIGFTTLAQLGCIAMFFFQQPELRFGLSDFDGEILRRGSRISSAHFALQCAGMLLLNSSVFLASYSLSAAAAAQYSVANRLASVCPMLAMLAAPYFWVAYADAIARNEHEWLRRAFRRHILVSIGSTALIAAGIAVIAPFVVGKWTRDSIHFDQRLLWWMLAWQLIIASMNPIGSLLNAYNRYTLQTVSSLAAGVVALLAGYYLSADFGLIGIIAATIFSYLLIPLPLVAVQTKRLLEAQQ
jgi:O-antigen/teichoic acid export membrane protein